MSGNGQEHIGIESDLVVAAERSSAEKGSKAYALLLQRGRDGTESVPYREGCRGGTPWPPCQERRW